MEPGRRAAKGACKFCTNLPQLGCSQQFENNEMGQVQHLTCHVMQNDAIAPHSFVDLII